MSDIADVTVQSADSPLGAWTVARWSPPASSPLSVVVEQIWYFEGTLTQPKERVFPNGRAELIVMLDEPHRDGARATLDPFPAVCINGLRTRPSVVVSPPGRCRVLGISFEPAGARALLGASMKELVDVTIDLRDSIAAAAAELGERCAGAAEASIWNPARNATAVLRAAAHWVQQHAGCEAVDPAVAWTLARIRAAGGIVSLDEIGRTLGLPRGRLAQRFYDRVGVTPKRFARIVRFDRALSRLGRDGGIAATAADLDYYDQAHLYRDFSEFAGMTPGAFLAARRYPNTPSLAET